jgi:hypothetical protein
MVRLIAILMHFPLVAISHCVVFYIRHLYVIGVFPVTIYFTIESWLCPPASPCCGCVVWTTQHNTPWLDINGPLHVNFKICAWHVSTTHSDMHTFLFYLDPGIRFYGKVSSRNREIGKKWPGGDTSGDCKISLIYHRTVQP